MERKDPWVVVALDHDEPSKCISRYFKDNWKETSLVQEKFSAERSYLTCDIVDGVKDLRKVGGKVLTVYGYGGAHHFTYGLCHVMRERRGIKWFTYVHIDNHTDSGKPYPSARAKAKGALELGCGSFTTEIGNIGGRYLLWIGTSDGGLGIDKYKDQFISASTFLNGSGKDAVVRKLLKKPKSTYLSIDLDITHIREVSTGFNRGQFTLEHLLDAIDGIRENGNLIGADVLGYRIPHGNTSLAGYYAPSSVKGNKQKPIGERPYKRISMLTYHILAAHIVGVPHTELSEERSELVGKLRD